MLTKSAVLTWLGIAMLVAASAVAIPRWKFIRQAQVASGLVVGLEFGRSHPKIAFQLSSREQVIYYQGGLIGGYEIGETARVLYLESDPKRTACVDTFGALWAAPALMGLVSCILIAAGRL